MGSVEDPGYPSPEIEGPTIDLALGENTYVFTWHDTLVRKFLIGEGEFDHLLHLMPDGTYLFLFLDGEDGSELKNRLDEHSFPVRVDPVLDESTIETYAKRQAADLDTEIYQEFS